MTDDHEQDLLSDRLHRLAGGLQPPPTDVASDLRRGRSRLAWQRTAVGGAALLTVGVIGGVAALGPGSSDAGHQTGYSGRPSSSTTPTPRGLPSSVTPTPGPPATTPTVGATLPGAYASVDPTAGAVGLGGFDQAGTATLQTYHDVLAQHLDPARDHLQPFSERTRNEQTSQTSGGVINGYGSKFGWSNAGSQGLGMLEIYVSRDWNGVDSFSPVDHWQDASVDGATRAQVAHDGPTVLVRVQRADGLTVALVADPLFGNNSTVAVPSMGLTAQQLLTAAVDPQLVLPPGP